jgi:Mg2+/Co2+ transporter CorB
MSISLTVLSVILVILILISCFFSASEIGMMSLNRYRLRHLVKKNHKQACRVNQLLSHPDKLFSVVLIGSTLANIVASTVATLIGQRLHGDMGVAVATTIVTLVVLIFAEMVPKTLAALYPQRVAFATVLPLMILQYILLPLVHVVSYLATGILRLSGVSIERSQKEALTREELRSVVHEAGGMLPVEHKGMLISLLDLESARVEDIIVPKSDIVGIDLDLPWLKVVEQLETAQHTRIPLYKGSLDHLVGMIHIRSVLNLALSSELNLESLIKMAEKPYFIPEATPLNVQILNFQKMKRRSCFVVDEYGELLGLVTLEDILEEVVGDFTTDIAALSKDITFQADGMAIIDASITLRQLERALSWQLPALGPRTLSGLIIEYLGYIPPADCCLNIEQYHIEIMKVADNTIKSVKMIKAPKKKRH